jgi:thymidylate synthase (FAD)
MTLINVLDHGFVRLVDSMGSDLSIVRAARVSYDADWRAGTDPDSGSDARLIGYLWRNQHTSPFEAVTLTFEVAAPIFVLRQWHRHRTASYNEVSARYTELPERFYVPSPDEIGVQAKGNKQMRALTGELNQTASDVIRHACELSFGAYHALLEQGVPRELARTVLPLATYSRMFVTLNLLNLFRFLTLRCHPHAQPEIRVYAEAMADLARGIAPVAVGVWRHNLPDQNAPPLSARP